MSTVSYQHDNNGYNLLVVMLTGPGGMELLAREDGWTMLAHFPLEDLSWVMPAFWDALAKVHALRHPEGGSPLAGCRPGNVLIK